ncbi:hypothetical protein [Rhizobium binae]|uniref:hypothetical protein n=1 Tax=Rhizobium binae TaxID=1138190 RepID=UPI001C828BF6|nr:hypothetical protein [Rhizobium binae]MBX4940889.1 hypothetical protein [Rhizobium binae]MBX4942295.1 hypothetical protein [Rhizobium binae]MBX4960622.1 hypothetical protein [Rhizobium binae]MBX4967050.1 hypothetical protein [Rhizobium binae]MBX4982015.1 hypothetical protein [Rhizobium binae]
MKHRRGIGLAPSDHHAVEIDTVTLTTLPQWSVIYACCRACRHQTLIERRELARRCGRDMSLAELAKRLKCQRCGNRFGNLLFLETLPRD